MDKQLKLNLSLPLLLLATSANACDTTALQLNLASKHFSDVRQETKFNEQNPGLGLVCHYSERADILVGAYRNSYNRDTAYIIHRHFSRTGPASFGISYGLASGYQAIRGNQDGVIPTGFVDVSIDFASFTAMAIYAPSRLIAKDAADVLTVTLQFPLR